MDDDKQRSRIGLTRRCPSKLCIFKILIIILPKAKKLKNSIYLDYAATTPVDPAVLDAMRPYWSKAFGNPSSLYKQGMEAKKAVDNSRKTIADILGARPSEIIFTAGGTESCNLAILGVANMARRKNTNRKTKKHEKFHIITSSIEHHAVLKPIEALKGEGYKITILDVDSDGLINIRGLEKAIRPETVLVSIMYANNEIGTIEPITEIGKRIARINIDRRKKNHPPIIFHTDACQAAGSLDLKVNRLNVDLMSVNGSKIYGPKQSGFLFVRNGVNLKPLIYGGGQERNLRSGTENVAGIVGLAKALALAQKNRKIENKRISRLQSYFIDELTKIQGVQLNGPVAGNQRLANNLNVTIKGVEGEALMLYLDAYGIAVSTGSACTTGLADPSHALMAIGCTPEQAKSSIRLTMGKQTTKRQIDYVLKALSPLIKQLRKTKNFLL